MSVDERYVWHEAFGPGPCGCPFDADALIDTWLLCPVEWKCRVCGLHTDNPPTDQGEPF
jgi:hypothetical protein